MKGGAFNGEFFQRISATSGLFGIVNRGLYCESGMFIVGGRGYEGSVYLRSAATSPVVVTVGLVEVTSSTTKPNGKLVELTVPPYSNWTRFSFSLVAAQNSSCPAGAERPGHPELGGIITCTGGLILSVAQNSSVDIDMTIL